MPRWSEENRTRWSYGKMVLERDGYPNDDFRFKLNIRAGDYKSYNIIIAACKELFGTERKNGWHGTPPQHFGGHRNDTKGYVWFKNKNQMDQVWTMLSPVA